MLLVVDLANAIFLGLDAYSLTADLTKSIRYKSLFTLKLSNSRAGWHSAYCIWLITITSVLPAVGSSRSHLAVVSSTPLVGDKKYSGLAWLACTRLVRKARIHHKTVSNVRPARLVSLWRDGTWSLSRREDARGSGINVRRTKKKMLYNTTAWK